MDMSDDPISVPKKILDLVGKSYLFKIEVKNAASSRFESSYRVQRICGDEYIIEQFNKIYVSYALMLFLILKFKFT